MPVPEIAEAIGRHLNLQARYLPAEEFGGMLMPLLSTDMPRFCTITQEQSAGPIRVRQEHDARLHVRGRITLLVRRICALCPARVVDDG